MSAITDAIVLALAVFCFRAVPILIWSVLDRRRKGPILLLLLAFVAGSGVCEHADVDMTEAWVRAPLAFAYFLFVALLAFEVWPWFGASLRLRYLVGPILFLLLLVVPALVVGSTPLLGPTMVIAWELWFASYAYFRSSEHGSRREMLFFLLVDPSLTWEERATPETPKISSVGRVVLGVTALAAETLVRVAMVALGIRSVDLLAVSTAGAAGGFLAFHFALGAAFYCAHSGLASVQIGLLRGLGYRCRERYRFPFLARTPADFWKRWNRYLGMWAERYLYVPMARRLQRRMPRSARGLATRAALVATFVVIGLAHDVLPWVANHGRLRFPVTLAFLFAGCSIVVWRDGARLLRRRAKVPRPVTVLLSRCTTWVLMSVFAWLVFPALTQRQLPAGLDALLQ